MRATKDSVPQGDGDILHRRFTDGVELSIVLQLWKVADPDPSIGEPACGEDLRLMLEHLGLYLQAILNGRGRWFWLPSGYGDYRMLDECRWLVDVSRDLTSSLTTVTFSIDSPFPCFIDATEQFGSDTTIASGDTVVLTNNGNHETYPVIEVYGTTSAWSVVNSSLVDQNGDPLALIYAGTTITTPDFAEVDVFANSIFLNGNQSDLAAGIDAEESDYFFLRPGDNEITAVGADVAFKFNNAWVPV